MNIRRAIGITGLAGVMLWTVSAAECVAEESSAAVVSENKAWKEELSSDKQAIRAQKDKMRSNAQAAKAEEKSLKAQIRQAKRSGDMATAQTLKDQYKAMHQENVTQKKEDVKALKTAKKEFKSDRKQAHADREGR